jgi:hypothetical protein
MTCCTKIGILLSHGEFQDHASTEYEIDKNYT